MLSKRFFLRSAPFCLALTLSACAGVTTDPGQEGSPGDVKEPATGEKDQLMDQQKTRPESIQDYKQQVEQKTSDLKKEKEAAVDQISRTRKTTDVIDPELRRMQTQGSKMPRVTRPTKM